MGNEYIPFFKVGESFILTKEMIGNEEDADEDYWGILNSYVGKRIKIEEFIDTGLNGVPTHYLMNVGDYLTLNIKWIDECFNKDIKNKEIRDNWMSIVSDKDNLTPFNKKR